MQVGKMSGQSPNLVQILGFFSPLLISFSQTSRIFVDGLEIPQLLYRVGVGHDHFLEALFGGPVFALPIIEPADVVIMGHNTLLAFEELFLGLPGVLGFGEGLNEPLKGLDGQACFLLVAFHRRKAQKVTHAIWYST